MRSDPAISTSLTLIALCYCLARGWLSNRFESWKKLVSARVAVAFLGWIGYVYKLGSRLDVSKFV